jgi:hypothetical protein
MAKRIKRRKNPGVRIIHNKLLGGWFIVRGPHQTPIGGRFNSKAEAQAHLRRKNPEIHIDIQSHNTKGGGNVRAKNPSRGRSDPAASHELFLSAINDANLYRQQIQPIIKNLQKKIAKGTYNAALALKLWRYAADTAAKRYTHGGYGQGKGYGIFTVPIREGTARELAEHYASEVNHKTNPIKGPGKFEGELYAGRYAYENVDEELGESDGFGWYGNFSDKIKGRGPFHIIVREDSQGFVYGEFFDTKEKMLKAWHRLEREYEKFSEESGEE